MTYIDLINDFWREFENEAMKPNDALLYLYLLKVCNSKGWENPFELSNKKIRLCLEITDKAIIESRERLVKRGLIKVSKGERNQIIPTYKLLKFCFPHESKKGSKKESRTAAERKQKRSRTEAKAQQNGSKTGNLIIEKEKDKEKDKENIVDVVVEAREGKKFLDEFFADTIQVEAFCMNNSISVADMRRLAEEVTTEWLLTGEKHDTEKDARRHLINHIRRKIEKSRQNGSTKPTGSSYEQRQAEFARHIAAKLAADDAEPDINGYY